MNLTKRLWALLLALTLVLGLGACGQKAQDTAADEPAATTDEPAAGDAGAETTGEPEATEEQEPAELTEITFVLDWTPNTNHTGVYVAQKMGYFEEAGLTVNVVQPPDGGAEMLVGSGGAQFGVSFQDYIAPAR